ncbi:hypothetical protein, partial [Pectobacterium odoriferum]
VCWLFVQGKYVSFVIPSPSNLFSVGVTTILTLREAPLPVDNYVATVKLIPLSSESRTVVQWMAAFDTRDPDPQGEQVADIRALIVGGHNSLQQFLSDGSMA